MFDRSGIPSRRRRAVVAVALGLVAAAAVVISYMTYSRSNSDFDQSWVAARALLSGADPYAAVTHWGWPWPFYYPLPAAVVAFPLALVPLAVARSLFAGTGVGVLVYLATRRGWWPLAFLASAPFLQALATVQWSPWLTAGFMTPAIAALWVVKPSLGVPLLVARPSRTALVAGMALLLLSIAIRPGWPASWLAALRESIHVAPLLRPGGVVLLLAFIRWKRPEARFLGALACVPHRPAFYELLPLLVIVPRTLRQAFVLVAAADLAYVVYVLVPHGTLPELDRTMWPVMLLLVYLPSLILILRRPNEGDRLASLWKAAPGAPGSSRQPGAEP